MVEIILGLIGTILYPLFSVIFVILAIVQSIFKAFAGVGTIGITGAGGGAGADTTVLTGANDGGEMSTGIVYYLLTRPLIKNLILSIMLLALFLIIIFTALAFIKNAYASKQKPWQDIVGNAFKGLAGFIFIPVCCLLGVWAGNILLNAIDGATSLGGSVELEKKLFIACAYNANEIRNDASKYAKVQDNGKTRAYNLCAELIADAVDTSGNKFSIRLEDRGTSNEAMEYYATVVDTIYSNADYNKSFGINIYEWTSVSRGYELWNINYLVLLVVGIFMIGIMINLAYGMIKRMFLLAMLFVVSPALCAMYPLDEGSAVGGYKKEFIKHTISAYGAVAAMNIFMSLLPFVQTINITTMGSNIGTSDIDLYVQIIVMVSGLFVVKEFISTLSGWIGGGNALADGESLKKNVTDSINKKVKTGVGAFSKALSTSKTTGRKRDFFGSLGKQAFDGVSKASGFDDLKKTWKESKEAGQKDVIDKYNKDKGKSEFNRNKWTIESAIAGAGGNALTPQTIANLLDNFKTDEGKAKAAEMIANYQNQVALRTNGKTTTKEKVLEATNTAKQAKASRTSAHDSRIDYETSFSEHGDIESDITAFQSKSGLAGLGISFDASGNIQAAGGFASQDDLRQWETLADDETASASMRQYARASLAEAKARLKEKEDYEKLLKDRENKVKEIKRSAIAFANSIISLSENYIGDDKAALKAIGEELKANVNIPAIDKATIETEFNNAKDKLQNIIANSSGKSISADTLHEIQTEIL